LILYLISFKNIIYLSTIHEKYKKEREKKNDDPQILYFKSNQGAFEFALISLMNGFGLMNSDFLGIITGKPFGKKKEV